MWPFQHRLWRKFVFSFLFLRMQCPLSSIPSHLDPFAFFSTTSPGLDLHNGFAKVELFFPIFIFSLSFPEIYLASFLCLLFLLLFYNLQNPPFFPFPIFFYYWIQFQTIFNVYTFLSDHLSSFSFSQF